MVKLVFEVGCSCMAISKPWVWITSKSTQLFDKGLGQTATSAWKYPKLNFEALQCLFCIYAHTQTQRYCFIPAVHACAGYKRTNYLSWHALNSMVQVKLTVALKSKDLATRGFQKNSRHTHWNPLKLHPVQKGQPTPTKLLMLFPTHLWVRECWPQKFSLS